jgi:hypothetical protein
MGAEWKVQKELVRVKLLAKNGKPKVHFMYINVTPECSGYCMDINYSVTSILVIIVN